MPSVVPDQRRTHGEGGYVIAIFGLLMIPLMAFVGFAVDLGSWYARAGHIQAASDAASLAGVTYLPDVPAATTAALEVARRNGFEDGVDGISISVVVPEAQQLRVEIRDTSVDQYFTGLFSDDVQIQRGATAEYVLPVAMGSPRNYLGTGNDPGNIIATSRHENFWLAVSGPCSARENGDLLQAETDQTYYYYPGASNQNPGANTGSAYWNRCRGSDSEGTTFDYTATGAAGSTYRQAGYFYAVEVPESRAGQNLQVHIYDAAHCTSSGAGDSLATPASTYSPLFRTRYRLRAPDTNPYIPTDNPLVAGANLALDSVAGTTGVCADSGSGYRNRWRQVFSVASAEAGIYFVQVTTEELSGTPDTALHGTNAFGLRAQFGGTFAECSADPNETTIYSASCAQVYAVDFMGVLANLDGTYPSFFLADIGPEHSGKDMVIGLFDPGEGAQALEILDPLGRSVDFDWEVVPFWAGEVAPNGGWSGVVDQPGSGPCSLSPPSCSAIDILGNPNTNYSSTNANYWRGWNPQPGPYFGSRSKYSARMLQLTVHLPDNIATEYSGRTWWRVRYHMGTVSGANTDRTTWSVRVLGDPVRLIK